MNRISVTSLEKFRRYMADLSSFDSEEALIESLKGLFKGNDKTKFGEAYHKIIEGKYFWHGKKVHVDDFVFTTAQAEPGIEFRASHRKMVNEMDLSKVYDTAFGPIQVGGRVDGIEGIQIRDIKTKFRSVNWQDYIDSIQWKLYLDIMELDEFYYDLFEIQKFTELPSKPPFEIDKEVRVINHPPLKCLRYSGMEDEIITVLNDFLEYIHNRNFISLLKPAIIKDELAF